MSKFKSAEKPVDLLGRVYHLRLKRGDIAPYVLLPGDPSRVLKIIKFWDEAKCVSKHRAYLTYTGNVDDIPISVCSTGIGGPSTAIAVVELAEVGATTFIRVGSTGAIQPEIACGDLIISSASVRLDGTSKQYVMAEYPAHAHYEILLALIEAAEQIKATYHVGITATTSSFYCGQGRRAYKGYWQSWMNNIIPDLSRAGVLSFEMENATIFTLANLFGLRAGSVCAVFANRIRNEFKIAGEEKACKVAVEAVKILYRMDEEKLEAGKKYWNPKLGKRENLFKAK